MIEPFEFSWEVTFATRTVAVEDIVGCCIHYQDGDEYGMVIQDGDNILVKWDDNTTPTELNTKHGRMLIKECQVFKSREDALAGKEWT